MTSRSELSREVGAMRRGAGVLALPELRTLLLTGPDRVRFLNGMVSNDVSLLGPGQGQRAVKTSPKGRVEGVLRVRAIGESFELDVDVSAAQRVCETLARFMVMDDCAISDISDTRTVLALRGPRAAELLAQCGASEAEALANLSTLDKGTFRIVRDGGLGVDGFDLFLSPNEGAAWLERLHKAGAVPVAAQAFDVLRIEAGVPKDGVDLDEEVIPLEARLDDAISTIKGCYVGQEVIARATNLGGVKHKLVGLLIDGDELPAVGRELLLADGSGKVTGEITSLAWSPTLERVIGLGYVRVLHEAVGTRLLVGEGAAAIAIGVAALPFV